MVVVMHAQPTSGTPNGTLLAVSSYATAPCIGLFFMLSGALRLSRPITDFRAFLLNIALRIFTPVFVWNILYGIAQHVDSFSPSGLSWQSLSVVWQQNNPTLWFIFPLLSLYLLTPILQPWLQQAGRKQLQFFLLLWTLTLCWSWWEQVLPLSKGTSSFFYYFSGYVGYYVLGHYVHHHSPQLSKTTFLAFGLAWLVPIVVKLSHVDLDFYHYFWYLSVFVTAQCVFYFQATPALTRKVSVFTRYSTLITRLSRLTFGVYLLHWGFILWCRHSLPMWLATLPYPLLYAVLALGCLIASFAISSLLHTSRWTRWLVGER